MQNFQRGYITVAILVFFAIVAFIIYPRDFEKNSKSVGVASGGPCAESPTSEDLAVPDGGGFEGPDIKDRGDGGGPKEGTSHGYTLIRKNVKLQTKFLEGKDVCEDGNDIYLQCTRHAIPYKTASGLREGETYMIYYPGSNGEITHHNNVNVIELNKYGVVFKVLSDGGGTPKVFKDEESGKDYNLVDVYHANGYPDPVEWDPQFLCSAGGGGSSKTNVEIPDQNVSQSKEQLQLEWFRFNIQSIVGEGGLFAAHCKPAIYLYPKDKQLVNVKVNTKGYLTYVDPKYPKDGWTVTAYPDGKIMDNLKPYDYLYYESKLSDKLIKKPEKGWVVEKGKLNNLFNEILPKLGLNQVQTNDFISYWDKTLPEANYYFIGIADQAEINNAEPLEITPKPDSINRVRIYFERLDEKKTVQAPELNTELRAQSPGFSVIEWGGLIKNDPNHPFICSQ